MDEFGVELDRLSQELEATETEMRQQVRPMAEGWYLSIGPVRLDFKAGPARIAVIYIMYNAICLAAGIALVFFRGIFAALGVALMVGALFSFGTFWAQFYAVAFQREQNVHDRIFANADYYANLQRLAEKRMELIDRMQRLIESDSRSEGAEGMDPPLVD